MAKPQPQALFLAVTDDDNYERRPWKQRANLTLEVRGILHQPAIYLRDHVAGFNTGGLCRTPACRFDNECTFRGLQAKRFGCVGID